MDNRCRRVHTKVTEADYLKLQCFCKAYGFRSLYQLLQSLLKLVLRYANTQEYEKEEYSMGKEVEDMFDDFLDNPQYKSYTTYQRQKER